MTISENNLKKRILELEIALDKEKELTRIYSERIIVLESSILEQDYQISELYCNSRLYSDMYNNGFEVYDENGNRRKVTAVHDRGDGSVGIPPCTYWELK